MAGSVEETLSPSSTVLLGSKFVFQSLDFAGLWHSFFWRLSFPRALECSQLAMASSAANRAFRNEGGSADVGAVNGAQCPKASQYLLEVAGHTRKHVWLPAW